MHIIRKPYEQIQKHQNNPILTRFTILGFSWMPRNYKKSLPLQKKRKREIKNVLFLNYPSTK
jgi:hypothetical protein